MPSSWPGRVRLLVVLAASAVLAVACGDDADGDLAVTSSSVSHETTQEIRVFEPDADGAWPVVMALHGIDGSSEDMAELGRRLAQHGILVFAPDYRTDFTTPDGVVDLARDIECAHRYIRSIAAEHGGDLDQPVTFVGWSLGATFALQAGLVEQIDPTGQFLSCFGDVPRPDVLVAVSGCHDRVPDELFASSEWTSRPAEIVLAAGDEDTTCPAAQTEGAAAELRRAGYDVDLVTLEGADHFAPVFHDLEDGELVPSDDEPAGERTIELVRDAIEAAS